MMRDPFYGSQGGEFKGQFELHPYLRRICMPWPDDVDIGHTVSPWQELRTLSMLIQSLIPR